MSIKVMTAVWEHGPQNSTQRFVLLALADYASDDGRNTYPAVETLAAKCALSERTVIRALDALIHDGYLVRQRRKDTTNLYQIVIGRLRQPVSDKLTPTPDDKMSPTVSDNLSPTEVPDCHPGKCQDVTPVGDTVSPDPSLIHHSNRQDEPSTAATATIAHAAAAPDPLAPILHWIGFADALTQTERAKLTPTTLLAWATWAKLKLAERGRGRIDNPIGWVRTQWRNDRPIRADLLRLAQGWLALDDDGRARLLGRLEWATEYAGYDLGDSLEDEFPDIPAAAAAAVFAATGGRLAPPELSPAAEPPRPTPSRPAPQTTPSTETTPSTTLWPAALAELELQMTRAAYTTWLQGTTATLDGDNLLVSVRNDMAIEWLETRLNDLVTRTVTALAGRPIIVRYLLPEAQP